MDTLEQASRKAKQVGRSIESSVGNLRSMMSSISLVGDVKHFQEGRAKFEEIRALLESRNEKQKLDGMKTLIAMMTLGRDVQAFFPHVVKNVAVDSMEVKKLVYMYIIQNASQNSDLALLSISSFQKDMSSPNPLVRAKALQAMSTMRVSSVVHLIIIQLKSAVKDSSAYVRRTAGHVLPIVNKLDTKFRSDLMGMLTILLDDDSVYVLSGALYAFQQICPKNWDLIHPNFRKICHLLADMDEWGQGVSLNILLRYARNQFKSPFVREEEKETKSEKKDSSDSSEEDDEEDLFNKKSKSDELLASEVELDPDHKMLITSAKNLVYTMNAGVALSVATLLYYIAPIEHCGESARALIHHVHTRREVSYVLLANIATMTNDRPEMFTAYYKDFYIRATEPTFLKEIKLDILSKLATESNINAILREYQAYAKDPDIAFRCATIDAMGRCASLIPEVAEQTLRGLMFLVADPCPAVVAASVVVIRQIIQRDPAKYDKVMLSLMKLLNKTNVPEARAAITWIVGEYRDHVAQYAPDALRMLAKSFIREADCVKMQILNLAVKVYLSNPKQIAKLFKYILEVCRYDANYDLRDRARLIRSIFFQKKKKDKNKESTAEASPENKDVNVEASKKLRKVMQEMFLATKVVPEIISPFKDRDRFVMGSLSHMVIHSAGDNYESLEDFPDIPPNTGELRNPPESSIYGGGTTPGTSRGKEPGKINWDQESSEETDDIEEYSSDSSDSSDGSSDTDSDEDSDETDSDDDDSDDDSDDSDDSSDEETDSDDDDDDDSDSDAVKAKQLKKKQLAAKKAAQKKKQQQEKARKKKQAQQSKKQQSSEDSDESDSDESSEEETSSDMVAEVIATNQKTVSKPVSTSKKESSSGSSKKKGDSGDTDSSDDSSSEEAQQKKKPTKKLSKKERKKLEREEKKRKKAQKKLEEEAKKQQKKANDSVFGTLEDLFGTLSTDTLPAHTPKDDNSGNVSLDPSLNMFDGLFGDSKPETTTTDVNTNESKVTEDTTQESKGKKSKKKGKKAKVKVTKEKKDKDSDSESGFTTSEDDDDNDDDAAQAKGTSKTENMIDSIIGTDTKEQEVERKDDTSIIAAAAAAADAATTKKTNTIGIFDAMLDDSMKQPASASSGSLLDFGGGGSSATGPTVLSGMKIASKAVKKSLSTDNVDSTAVGESGELLNHTHSAGLQINYEYVRTQSAHGKQFNLVRLKFENKWDKKIEKINVKPVNIDKNEQDFHGLGNFGGIDVLEPNFHKSGHIHVKFGSTSYIKLEVNAKGTSRERFACKLNAAPGESMRPNNMDYESFKSKQAKLTGMVEKKFDTKCKTLDEAVTKVMKIFNVAPLSSGYDMNESRCFAGQLLKDEKHVFVELTKKAKKDGSTAIVCRVNCDEMMKIDTFGTLAKSALT